MTGLLRATWSIYRTHGLLAAIRAFRCGYWWGRRIRREHTKRMAEIRDVNECHRAAFVIEELEHR